MAYGALMSKYACPTCRQGCDTLPHCPPKPRLRLHFGHAGYWYVAGPKGKGWIHPTARGAVMDYVAYVGL